MLRVLLTLVFASSVGAISSRGVLTEALRNNLRSRQSLTGNEELVVETQARAALEALLDVSTDSLSEAYYMGLSAPLSQFGYEQSLGNAAMTAFVTKYMESKQLICTDAGALQGFVMYYDGSCHKKAFKDLVEELGPPFVGNCHDSWVKSSTNMMEFGRAVSSKEFKAMLQKESITLRAAAFSAAGNLQQKASSLESLRSFIRKYISELNGNVRNELNFETFLSKFISQAIDADDPLEMLIDLLMEESERKGAFVEMPRLPTRTVKLLKEQKKEHATNGIGKTAPLDEPGYSKVADTGDNDQMVTFITRTADSMGLSIVKTKEQSVAAFAKWYDNTCAKQSFTALKSELRSEVGRPAVCGGGWVETAEDELEDTDETEDTDVLLEEQEEEE